MENKNNFESLLLSVDEEGFVQSFSFEDENEILNFWKQYGFVVVKNVITEEDVNNTIEEIWKFQIEKNGKVDRNDPLTWNNNNWPSDMGLSEGGFLSHFSDIELQWSWNNRQNPKNLSNFLLLYLEERIYGLILIDMDL